MAISTVFAFDNRESSYNIVSLMMRRPGSTQVNWLEEEAIEQIRVRSGRERPQARRAKSHGPARSLVSFSVDNTVNRTFIFGKAHSSFGSPQLTWVEYTVVGLAYPAWVRPAAHLKDAYPLSLPRSRGLLKNSISSKGHD